MSVHGDHDLGHTVAGWTGTAIGTLGSAVLGAAVVTASAALLWLGAAIVVLAALTCWILHLAGWGKATGPRPAGRQGLRTRDAGARRGHPGCLGCRLAGRSGAPAAEPRPGARAALARVAGGGAEPVAR
ncbi:HGxxPAAW family protein [Streptomyces argenteolus]|uniref:HGxxPAAW family protein n=1 Tax=Streptomyces argenteolus TaxID=67274 RepID=A0ABW6X394_9ACTN